MESNGEKTGLMERGLITLRDHGIMTMVVKENWDEEDGGGGV